MSETLSVIADLCVRTGDTKIVILHVTYVNECYYTVFTLLIFTDKETPDCRFIHQVIG